jgi:hypothetical protein
LWMKINWELFEEVTELWGMSIFTVLCLNRKSLLLAAGFTSCSKKGTSWKYKILILSDHKLKLFHP